MKNNGESARFGPALGELCLKKPIIDRLDKK